MNDEKVLRARLYRAIEELRSNGTSSMLNLLAELFDAYDAIVAAAAEKAVADG